MKTIKLIMLAAVALLLTACGGSSGLMVKSKSQAVPPASEDVATIVFMRTSFVAGAINVELFEAENDKLRFIGSLPMGSKIVYKTTPGSKNYMAYGSAADFMIADNISAGQTYYVIVRPNWGTGGFAPTPVRKQAPSEFNMQSKDFSSWVSSTKLLEPKSAEADKWFQDNKTKYQEIYKDYWARFEGKSYAQKKERTLTAEDGVKK